VSAARIVSREGVDAFVREGYGRFRRDAYHYLLDAPWPRLIALLVGLYLVANSLFAAAYLLQPGSIENARPGSFADAFFFSVQTMATIGYGKLLPGTTYANVLVVLETSTGVIGLAMLTGLIFAKFSRPTARVLFSEQAVVTIRDGVPCLMVRMANARSTWIIEADARLVLARWETTREGESVRRFYDLELTRTHNSLFALSWTLVHPLAASSPLHGATPASLAEGSVEIVVSVVGLDETVSQAVHARWSWVPEEIRWGARFVDVITRLPDGRQRIDLTHFHDAIDDPASLPPWLIADGR
jgi:inward rectifier potassium channel